MLHATLLHSRTCARRYRRCSESSWSFAEKRCHCDRVVAGTERNLNTKQRCCALTQCYHARSPVIMPPGNSHESKEKGRDNQTSSKGPASFLYDCLEIGSCHPGHFILTIEFKPARIAASSKSSECVRAGVVECYHGPSGSLDWATRPWQST